MPTTTESRVPAQEGQASQPTGATATAEAPKAPTPTEKGETPKAKPTRNGKAPQAPKAPKAPELTEAEKAIAAELEAIKTLGGGRYSNLMKETYRDCKRLLGLNQAQAIKVAKALGADLGRVNFQSAVKFGKHKDKDNSISLRDVASIKGVTATYAITTAKFLALLNEANSLKAFRVDANGVRVEFGDLSDWLKRAEDK